MDFVFQNKRHRIVLAIFTGLAVPLFGKIGWLSVRTPSPGFAVFLEDTLIGHSPLDSVRVGVGTWTVRVLDPQHRRWLQPEYRTRVTIQPDSKTVVEASGPNGFWIDSMPSHAEVLKDGKRIGHTPYFVMDTTFHAHVLSVRSGNQTIPIDLKSTEGTIRVVFDAPRQDLWRGNEISHPFHSRRVRTAAGLSLALGMAGYIIKNQAEQAYRRYRSATHPHTMEVHFERALRYDRIAAACYIAGEVALGITVVLAIKGSAP